MTPYHDRLVAGEYETPEPQPGEPGTPQPDEPNPDDEQQQRPTRRVRSSS